MTFGVLMTQGVSTLGSLHLDLNSPTKGCVQEASRSDTTSVGFHDPPSAIMNTASFPKNSKSFQRINDIREFKLEAYVVIFLVIYDNRSGKAIPI